MCVCVCVHVLLAAAAHPRCVDRTGPSARQPLPRCGVQARSRTDLFTKYHNQVEHSRMPAPRENTSLLLVTIASDSEQLICGEHTMSHHVARGRGHGQTGGLAPLRRSSELGKLLGGSCFCLSGSTYVCGFPEPDQLTAASYQLPLSGPLPGTHPAVPEGLPAHRVIGIEP